MAVNKTIDPKIAQLRDRRWSEADARIVIDALARSGEPVTAFARRHGLDKQRIYKWRTRLSEEARDREDETDTENLSFAPVVVTGLGRAPVVVVRIGELEVEVHDPQKVDPSWFAQVIAATRSA